MLKISEFANMVGVSEQTLKFYERKGLFMPAEINKSTGYRYYSTEQLLDFQNIATLKLLRYSLKEIKESKSGERTVEEQIEALKKKRDELDRSIKMLSEFNKNKSPYTIGIKTEKPFYCVLKSACAADINDLKNIIFGFYAELAEKHVRFSVPYYTFCEFTDNSFMLDNIHSIIRIGVRKGEKNAKFFDKTTYLYTIHTKSYETLGDAYDFLLGVAGRNNLKITGNPQERYISVPEGEDSKFITEVRFPIIPRSVHV